MTEVRCVGCDARIGPAKCGEGWCQKCVWTSREWTRGIPKSLYCRCHRIEVEEDDHCNDWMKDD